MEFEIAKKLEKLPANIKGNSLRSIKADSEGATMIIVADAYGDIKTGVENYRMATNADISFRMRGKSIDVTVLKNDDPAQTGLRSDAALSTLMEFAKTISFNSEDATDVIEFWNRNMPLEGCSFKEIEMDQTRLRLIMTTEELTEELQAKIMSKLDEYNMGIVK